MCLSWNGFPPLLEVCWLTSSLQERKPAVNEMRRPVQQQQGRPFKGKEPNMQFFGPSDFVPELPHNVQVAPPPATILQGFDCFRRSFVKSVSSSLRRKRQPSADIARERTSSTGTRSCAKSVLTQPAQQQQHQQQQQQLQRPPLQPQQRQQFLQRVNLWQLPRLCGRSAGARHSGRRTRTLARMHLTSARTGCSGRPTLGSARRTRRTEPGWKSVARTRSSWRTRKTRKFASSPTLPSQKLTLQQKSLTAWRIWWRSATLQALKARMLTSARWWRASTGKRNKGERGVRNDFIQWQRGTLIWWPDKGGGMNSIHLCAWLCVGLSVGLNTADASCSGSRWRSSF